MKFFRLGKYDSSRQSPRIIKITLSEEKYVHDAIRNTKKLLDSDDLKHIKISMDRTKRQIEYYKSVKSALDNRISSGENNLKIKYINGIPQIVKLN